MELEQGPSKVRVEGSSPSGKIYGDVLKWLESGLQLH